MSNAYPGAPPLRKKSNPWMWVGLGCVVVIVGCIAFAAFLITVVFAAMRSSQPYKDAMRHAREDTRVTAALGTPIEAGMFVSGNVNTQNDAGDANLSIPIHGPNGKGTLRVTGTKSDGKWSYSRMRVTLAGGQEIDLLSSSSLSRAQRGISGAPATIAQHLLQRDALRRHRCRSGDASLRSA